MTEPVIIIGAGPAGLATGACLRRAGIDTLFACGINRFDFFEQFRLYKRPFF